MFGKRASTSALYSTRWQAAGCCARAEADTSASRMPPRVMNDFMRISQLVVAILLRPHVRAAHDESPGCVAQEIKRVTGHERDRRIRSVGERPEVRGIHNLGRDNAVGMQPVLRFDLDLLARRDVLEDPEETVPMPGD